MKPRNVLALLLALFVYLQPGVALATTKWSAETYFKKYWPPSWSPPAASACGQSGIYDIAQNWNLAYTRSWIDHSCSGSNYTVGPSFLGTRADGYMNFSYCGTTGTYWNSGNVSGWAVSAYLCPNPSGLQPFSTVGYSTFWEGTGWYYSPGVATPTSSW